MVCVTWLSPILINGDAFYSLQLPSPQVLKALTIQTLELNAKPCELRIYCSKEEITQELKINPVVNLRRLLSYCFLLQWIPSDLEWISCLDKSWPPTNLCISGDVNNDSPGTMQISHMNSGADLLYTSWGYSVGSISEFMSGFQSPSDKKLEHWHHSSQNTTLTTWLSCSNFDCPDAYEKKFKGLSWPLNYIEVLKPHLQISYLLFVIRFPVLPLPFLWFIMVLLTWKNSIFYISRLSHATSSLT